VRPKVNTDADRPSIDPSLSFDDGAARRARESMEHQRERVLRGDDDQVRATIARADVDARQNLFHLSARLMQDEMHESCMPIKVEQSPLWRNQCFSPRCVWRQKSRMVQDSNGDGIVITSDELAQMLAKKYRTMNGEMVMEAMKCLRAGPNGLTRVVRGAEFRALYGEGGENFVTMMHEEDKLGRNNASVGMCVRGWLGTCSRFFANMEVACKLVLAKTPKSGSVSQEFGGVKDIIEQICEYYYGFAQHALLDRLHKINAAPEEEFEDLTADLDIVCALLVNAVSSILHSLAHARLPYDEKYVDDLHNAGYTHLAARLRSKRKDFHDEATAYDFTHEVLMRDDTWELHPETKRRGEFARDSRTHFLDLCIHLYNDMHLIYPVGSDLNLKLLREEWFQNCTHIRAYVTRLFRQVIRTDVGLFWMQQKFMRRERGYALMRDVVCGNLVAAISTLTGDLATEESYDSVHIIHRLLTGRAYGDMEAVLDAVRRTSQCGCESADKLADKPPCSCCSKLVDPRLFNELFAAYVMNMDGEKRELFIKSLLDLLDPEGVNIGDGKNIFGKVCEVLSIMLSDVRLVDSLSDVAVAKFCSTLGVIFKYSGAPCIFASPKPYADRFGADAPHWHDYVQGMEINHSDAVSSPRFIIHFGVEILTKVLVPFERGPTCGCQQPPPSLILRAGIRVLLDGILVCILQNPQNLGKKHVSEYPYYPVLRLIPPILKVMNCDAEILFCVDKNGNWIDGWGYDRYIAEGKFQVLVYALQLAIAKDRMETALGRVNETCTQSKFDERISMSAKQTSDFKNKIGVTLGDTQPLFRWTLFTGAYTPFEFALLFVQKEVNTVGARLRENESRSEKDNFAFEAKENVFESLQFAIEGAGSDPDSYKLVLDSYKLDASIACFALQGKMRTIHMMTNAAMKNDWRAFGGQEPLCLLEHQSTRELWGVRFDGLIWSSTLTAEAAQQKLSDMENRQLSLPLVPMYEIWEPSAMPTQKRLWALSSSDEEELHQCDFSIESLCDAFDSLYESTLVDIKCWRRIWRVDNAFIALLVRFGEFSESPPHRGVYKHEDCYKELGDEELGDSFLRKLINALGVHFGWLTNFSVDIQEHILNFCPGVERFRYERISLRALHLANEIVEALYEFFSTVTGNVMGMSETIDRMLCSTFVTLVDCSPSFADVANFGAVGDDVGFLRRLMICAAELFYPHDNQLNSELTSEIILMDDARSRLHFRSDMEERLGVTFDCILSGYCGDPAILGARLKLSASCLRCVEIIIMTDINFRRTIREILSALEVASKKPLQSELELPPLSLTPMAVHMLQIWPDLIPCLTACISAPLHLTEELNFPARPNENRLPLRNHVRILLEISKVGTQAIMALFQGVEARLYDNEGPEYSLVRHHKGKVSDLLNRLASVLLVTQRLKQRPTYQHVRAIGYGKNPWKAWGFDFDVSTVAPQLVLFNFFLCRHTAFTLESVPGIMTCVVDMMNFRTNVPGDVIQACISFRTLMTSNELPAIIENHGARITKYAARFVAHPKAKKLKCNFLRCLQSLAPTKDHTWIVNAGIAKLGVLSDLDEDVQRIITANPATRAELSTRLYKQNVTFEPWCELFDILNLFCYSRPWRQFLLSMDPAATKSECALTKKALASMVHLSASDYLLPGQFIGLRGLISLAGYHFDFEKSQVEHSNSHLGVDPASTSAVLRALQGNIPLLNVREGIFKGLRQNTAEPELNVEPYLSTTAKYAAEIATIIFSELTNAGKEIVEKMNEVEESQLRAMATSMVSGVHESGHNYASTGAYLLFLMDFSRRASYANYEPLSASVMAKSFVEGYPSLESRCLVVRSLLRGCLGPVSSQPSDLSSTIHTTYVISSPRQQVLEHFCNSSALEDRGFDYGAAHGVVVTFTGELGEGAGIRREWFSLIGDEAANFDRPLFITFDGATAHPHPNVVNFTEYADSAREYFYALGRVVALALYHAEVVPIRFSEAFAFAVMCADFENLVIELGCFDNSVKTELNLQTTIEDRWKNQREFGLRDLFEKLDPKFFDQIQKSVLDATADELKALDLRFTDTYDFTAGKGGVDHRGEYDLLSRLMAFKSSDPSTKAWPPGYERGMKGGGDVKVTVENRYHYVRWLAFSRCFGRSMSEITEFRHGMIDIIGEDTHAAIGKMLTPKEFVELLAGKASISIDEWRKFTEYDEVADWRTFKDSHTVEVFWKAMSLSSQRELMQVLEFSTGLKHPPVSGFRNLIGFMGETARFKLGALPATSRFDAGSLPMAHTCFNLLRLPFFRPPPENASTTEKEQILLEDAFIMLDKLRVVSEVAGRGFDSF